MASLTREFQAMLGKERDNPDELLLDVFFTQSAGSRAAGRAFLERLHARKADRDMAVDEMVAPPRWLPSPPGARRRTIAT